MSLGVTRNNTNFQSLVAASTFWRSEVMRPERRPNSRSQSFDGSPKPDRSYNGAFLICKSFTKAEPNIAIWSPRTTEVEVGDSSTWSDNPAVQAFPPLDMVIEDCRPIKGPSPSFFVAPCETFTRRMRMHRPLPIPLQLAVFSRPSAIVVPRYPCNRCYAYWAPFLAARFRTFIC